MQKHSNMEAVSLSLHDEMERCRSMLSESGSYSIRRTGEEDYLYVRDTLVATIVYARKEVWPHVCKDEDGNRHAWYLASQLGYKLTYKKNRRAIIIKYDKCSYAIYSPDLFTLYKNGLYDMESVKNHCRKLGLSIGKIINPNK